MSGRRRRSDTLWDREEAPNETKEFNSSGDSPKRSNSEINDVLMPDDFSMQGIEYMLTDNDNIGDKHRMKNDPAFDDWDGQYGQPYRGDNRLVGGKDRARSRSRSWSPHQTRDRDQDQYRDRDLDQYWDRDQDQYRDRDQDQYRDRDQDRTRIRDRDPDRTRGWDWDRGRPRGLARSRSRSRSRGRDQGRATSPSRGGSNRLDNDSTKKWSSDRPEYSGGSQYHRTDKSGYNDQDHRRHLNQDNKRPCKFFIMGRCNRDNCRFSHDVPKSEVHEGRSHDHNDFSDSNPNFDDKNRSWKGSQLNNLESGSSYNLGLDDNQDARFIPISADSRNVNLNGNGSNHQVDGSVNEDGNSLQTSRNDIPQATNLPQISQNLNLVNALGLLYSSGLADSTMVNELVKASASTENQKSTEPVANVEVNDSKIAENLNLKVGKTEAEGKVDEGNLGNDEKAMRAFKNALVEFVKEILKPTWKEGKMSRDVYKTIVKKVVEKVTSTIQGVQIPRTQEKIDQYLTFSKSKITKLVEAYVGRLVKA
ncbi:hypothetical protein QVD17_01305 [Tagetes erecta]|uniref:C3H1-type domain-containing protein n=1 Tax=Tagetes erecta TaxID=13708 RepID=A0AAD8L4Q0_TARER|nr:hypothetical protein QVD17_01305 [Tagetes erecta]